MNTNWTEGDPILAKDNATIRNCGVIPGAATGHVTCTKNGLISFELPAITESNKFSKRIEGRCSPETFGNNFKLNGFQGNNKGYISSTHFSKKFPEDFLNS